MPQSVGGAVSLQCVCRYKIQPEKNAPLEMKKLMKVVRHVLVNQVQLYYILELKMKVSEDSKCKEKALSAS